MTAVGQNRHPHAPPRLLPPTDRHVIQVRRCKQEVHVAGEHDDFGAQEHHDEVPPEHDGSDEAAPEHDVCRHQVGSADELSL